VHRTRAIEGSWPFLFLLACLLLLPGLTLGAEEPALTVGLEAGGQSAELALPRVSRAVYEIHVWGGMAVGQLTQEFVNEQERETRVLYSTTNALGIDVQRIELESDGALYELKLERLVPKQKKSARNTGKTQRVQQLSRIDGIGSAAVARIPRTVQTEPFDLAAEASTTVHADLSWPILLEGRIFRLTLPAIRPAGELTGEAEPIPLQLSITVHSDRQLDVVESDTHQILVDFVGDKTIIEPVDAEIAGNRPFELRFAVNDRTSPTVTGYHVNDGAGRVGIEALIQPPEAPGDGTVRPKQLLFILDSSGSMKQDDKMDQARRAVLSCVEKLTEADRFNIVEFDQVHRMMLAEPVAVSSFGKEQVAEWLEQVKANGGTLILSALEATLEQPEDPERHRMIVVVTDGIIKDEAGALALLREKLGDARLFVVGTGRHHRQETLLRLAEYGRGVAVFANEGDALEQAVDELYAAISRPLGWDVELSLGSAVIDEILPSRIPDLYAGRGVRVIAWVDGDLPSQMTLRMSTEDGARVYRVLLPPLAD